MVRHRKAGRGNSTFFVPDVRMTENVEAFMVIDNVPIGSIFPYENNPRQIPDSAVAEVSRSIEKFGWQQPIVVDKSNIIIVGHTRFMAAKKLHLETVPVHVANLSEQDAAAYRLLDNKLNELASWDQDLVSIELEKLADLDIELLELFNDLEEQTNSEISAFDELISGDSKVEYEGAGKNGDWVTLSFVMPPEERDMVQEALRNVQNQEGLMNTTQSLIKILKEYA